MNHAPVMERINGKPIMPKECPKCGYNIFDKNEDGEPGCVRCGCVVYKIKPVDNPYCHT